MSRPNLPPKLTSALLALQTEEFDAMVLADVSALNALTNVWPQCAEKGVPIGRTFMLKEMADAHTPMESGTAGGKILVLPR